MRQTDIETCDLDTLGGGLWFVANVLGCLRVQLRASQIHTRGSKLVLPPLPNLTALGLELVDDKKGFTLSLHNPFWWSVRAQPRLKELILASTRTKLSFQPACFDASWELERVGLVGLDLADSCASFLRRVACCRLLLMDLRISPSHVRALAKNKHVKHLVWKSDSSSWALEHFSPHLETVDLTFASVYSGQLESYLTRAGQNLGGFTLQEHPISGPDVRRFNPAKLEQLDILIDDDETWTEVARLPNLKSLRISHSPESDTSMSPHHPVGALRGHKRLQVLDLDTNFLSRAQLLDVCQTLVLTDLCVKSYWEEETNDWSDSDLDAAVWFATIPSLRRLGKRTRE